MKFDHLAAVDALVAVARQLLDAGLSTLLAQGLERKEFRSEFDESDVVVRLVFAALSHRLHDILQVLLRIGSAYESGAEEATMSSHSRAAQDVWFSLLSESPASVAIDHSHIAFSALSSQRFGENATAATLRGATIVADPLHCARCDDAEQDAAPASFRRLRATQGLGRGATVLREAPYALCISPRDPLRIDEHSSLLHEHLLLAVALFREREKNPHKYARMRRLLCSGLPSYLQSERLRESFRDTQRCFAAPTVQLMSVFCALFVMLRFFYAESSFESFSCASFVQRVADVAQAKESLIAEARELLDVLGALQLNTHAVTRVAASFDDAQATVETERVAVALFLSASAVNHSCAPNAALRFEGADRDATPHELLENVLLGVFALRTVARDEELLVSYGVLAGRHALRERENVLGAQYLFVCRCSACEAERSRHSEDLAREKSQNANRVRAQFVDVEAERVKAFCRGLDAQRDALDALNAVLAERLHLTKHSVSSKPLDMFESELLRPREEEMKRLRLSLSTVVAVWAAIETFYQRCRDDSDSAAMSLGECLALCNALSEMDRAIVREFVVLQCALLDVRAQLLSAQGRFLLAADAVLLETCAWVAAGLYPDDDIVVARERVKLASLYFNGGEMHKCRRWALQAAECLRVFAATDDPDRQQAEQMLLFTKRLLGR